MNANTNMATPAEAGEALAHAKRERDKWWDRMRATMPSPFSDARCESDEAAHREASSKYSYWYSQAAKLEKEVKSAAGGVAA